MFIKKKDFNYLEWLYTERRHMNTGNVCEFFILLLYIIKIIFH
jgi:hypothetical protein